ncbi:sugar ABC transporter ATP-binding protein [Aporhodopirellula aestuarii]|uniref:Sugar ABC transporter ATP-binding protein n=1 Tax=Aporhodopirellula aestuarii TaxID=2950107 RepID=A0ABT0U7L0_9BACT|nr:sugar ABC transporter ATP-binding protein [Aporhodopirellula aestuarii]MCM2372914.1 sugar ABC transporter ATP-binding protein [Aporhodopirellula aestuarii]
MIPRLTLTGIRKSFGATRALDGVDLNVQPGEVHAIIGENGAGKSTLMRVLSGAHRPDEGEIRFDGELVDFAGPRDSQSIGIAMIYQELNLAPDLSVCENITLGREPRTSGTTIRRLARGVGWVDRAAERQWATEALQKLNCGHLSLDRQAGELSIAEQQMVEIARAVVTSTNNSSSSLKLLILDEPTSSLTQVDTQRLFDVIERLAADGVSILYISHFLEECERIADRFTVLRDGRTVATGRMPGEHSDQANLPSVTKHTDDERTDVDDANVQSPAVADDDPPTPMDQIIRYMVGRDMSDLYPKFTHTRGEVALEVKQVCSEAGPRSVSFQLHRGEILGIAGLIGAGRTETLRAIFGLDAITDGVVCVAGKPPAPRRPDLSWVRDSMGLVSEDRKNEGLFLDRSLTDNLTITRMDSYRKAGLLDIGAMSRSTQTWMQRLDVKASSAQQPIGELSGGNQQKIALARLLHHDCEILLLDEPTRGIDIGSKGVIYRQIGELAASGKAILLVSSYLPELLGVCDSIGVFSRGVLTDVRETSQWTEHELLTAAIG